MNIHEILFAFLIAVLSASCGKSVKSMPPKVSSSQVESDSIDKALGWKKVRCGLYSKDGEIGFREAYAVGPEGCGGSGTRYLTRFGWNDEDALANVIDTTTFVDLGASYYNDKNHVYNYFAMAHGGRLYVVETADVLTFEVIGDCYAKDKNYVYVSRHGIIEDADLETFISKKGIGCYAKDKFGYFEGERRVDIDSVFEKDAMETVRKLGK